MGQAHEAQNPEAGSSDAVDAPVGCSCSEARAHLERFLDHECDGDLDERLRAHVATCEHCSRVADAEVHLREILRSRCAEQAPPELRERVLGRLSVVRSTMQVTQVAFQSSYSSPTGSTSFTSRTTRYTRG